MPCVHLDLCVPLSHAALPLLSLCRVIHTTTALRSSSCSIGTPTQAIWRQATGVNGLLLVEVRALVHKLRSCADVVDRVADARRVLEIAEARLGGVSTDAVAAFTIQPPYAGSSAGSSEEALPSSPPIPKLGLPPVLPPVPPPVPPPPPPPPPPTPRQAEEGAGGSKGIISPTGVVGSSSKRPLSAAFLEKRASLAAVLALSPR